MEAKATALVLVALLLAPGALAWDQAKGGPDRNGRVALPPGPLDILHAGRVDDDLYAYWGSIAVPTPHGLVALGLRDGCRILVLADPTRPPEAIPIEACSFATLAGYDAARDRALVCVNGPGTAPILQAWDLRARTMVWGVVPERDFQGPFGPVTWLCRSPAIDPASGEVVAAFVGIQGANLLGAGDYDATHHVIASLALADGRVEWETMLPLDASAIPLDFGAVPDPNPQGWIPQGVTLSSTGVFVSGYTHRCPSGACEDGFIGWFTRDGLYGGIERAQTGKPPSAADPRDPDATLARAVAQYVVTEGPLGIATVGREIVLVNPEQSSPVHRASATGIEPPAGGTLFAMAGHAGDGLATLAFRASVNAYSTTTLERVWSWGEGREWLVADIVAARGDVLLALVALTDPAEGVARPLLVQLHAPTGDVLSRIPLPEMGLGAITGGDSYYARVLPRDATSLVVLAESGDFAILGLADPGDLPDVALSAAYPQPGEEVHVATRDGRFRVDWGDGTIEEGNGTFTHAFATRGPRDVRVTALHDDGTTATRVLVADVGGTAPPQLTALQRAFSPENQEVTFFVLGLVVTLVGVAFTIGRQRRRFNRIERELAAVEEIRMMSVSDPRAAVLALKEYRDRLPDELARRRIDDSQFQVLDVRSARLLKVLRTRLLARYDARLSPRYHRLLDAAFEDAILQPAERLALVHALDGETDLRPADREEIVALLDDFTSERRAA